MDDIDHLIKTVFEQTEIKWQEVSQYIANTSLDGGRYSIFYNDPFHTLKKGDIYLVGLNPGGDPQKTKFNVKDEISEFKKFYSSHNRSFSAYLDEVWGNTGSEYEKGQASHQKRVKELIESVSNCLGQFCSVRDIFAANLIFFRTKNKNELSTLLKIAKDAKILDYCWKCHMKFLEVVRPKIILCNGNGDNLSSYSYIRRFLNSDTIKAENAKQFGKKKIKFLEAIIEPLEKVLIIGIPHLSYPSVSKQNGGYQILKEKIDDFMQQK